MAADVFLDIEDVERKKIIVDHAWQAFGTEELSSEMSRLSTGTGSVESAYYFAMGRTYYWGTFSIPSDMEIQTHAPTPRRSMAKEASWSETN